MGAGRGGAGQSSDLRELGPGITPHASGAIARDARDAVTRPQNSNVFSCMHPPPPAARRRARTHHHACTARTEPHTLKSFMRPGPTRPSASVGSLRGTAGSAHHMMASPPPACGALYGTPPPPGLSEWEPILIGRKLIPGLLWSLLRLRYRPARAGDQRVAAQGACPGCVPRAHACMRAGSLRCEVAEGVAGAGVALLQRDGAVGLCGRRRAQAQGTGCSGASTMGTWQPGGGARHPFPSCQAGLPGLGRSRKLDEQPVGPRPMTIHAALAPGLLPPPWLVRR